MGCRCDDAADGMHISCAVAPHFESTAEDMPPYVFDVVFQVPTTAQYMTCARSKISVQSIRWPATRYTALNPDVEVVTEPRVDAAVWVMPLCGLSGDFPEVCLGGEAASGPDVVFDKAACFPYCMALREREAVRQNLVLFSAREWE
eukprot:2676201-Rhodomonas_salina.1